MYLLTSINKSIYLSLIDCICIIHKISIVIRVSYKGRPWYDNINITTNEIILGIKNFLYKLSVSRDGPEKSTETRKG